MNILAELKNRFRDVLAEVSGRNGCAKSSRHDQACTGCSVWRLSGELHAVGETPRETSREKSLGDCQQNRLDDLCSQTDIAGPGFINLTIDDQWITSQVNTAGKESRLGVTVNANPQTFILDYSSPNVAKPMHVGHIRSTVIGDSLARTLRFLGHQVIADNHLGDWGTQFGMIIYGYKHFVNAEAYQQHEVRELSRLYRLVNQLIDYWKSKGGVAAQQEEIARRETVVSELEAVEPSGDKRRDKKHRKALGRARDQLTQACEVLESLKAKYRRWKMTKYCFNRHRRNPEIARNALLETAQLHEGDATNRQLWEEFLQNVVRTSNGSMLG